MAFSQNDDAPVSQMESLLTCSICLETFNDPRTLPCFHSFCRHCLERFVKIQRDNALVDDEIEEFNCPTCRSRFSLKSNENVESMGFSHFIRNMLDVVSVQRQAKNKPAICSKIQCGQPAIAYCTKCELFKCEKCLEFHGSLLAFAKHTVLSMSELPEETATFRCKKHKKEALKFYCQTCNELVCRYCKDLDHVKQNHSCVLAEDYVAYEKRQAFKTSIDDLERKLKKGSEALQAITDVMQRLKYNVDRAKHEVTRHKQEILEKFTLELEQNVKDQINCLDLKYNQSYLSLAKQSSALKSHVDKVESSMDFAKNLLENGNLDDILSSQGLIEQTIEKLEKDYPQTVKPVHNGNIKYQGKPVLVGKMKELLADLFEKAEMSEVSTSSTPQRQAIVDRLRQRIETFRKHHDNCLARLEETQPSRELEEQEETQLLHIQFLENKVKMNPKIRLDQVGKISKQGVNVGQEKAANTAMKRRVDSPQPQIDGEGNLPSNDDLASLVPQKYQRFEGPSDVHVKVKPPNFAGPGDTLPLQTSMSFPHVNGHGGEFPKSEELSKPVVSSYSGSTCENIDRMVTRVPQQYPGNFTSSTFTNRGQPSVSDNLRTSDYPVNFKQENGLLNSDVEGPASIVNGFSSTCTKSEGEFGRLLTTYAENPKSKSKDEDLKTQISQFELVLQGIKNRDGIYNESESKKDVLATAKQPMNTQSSSLVSGLSDSVSHEGAKGSNQLGLSNGNGPNNGTRLPTVAVTSSTHRQHGISPSTAEALQQFVTQKEERLATKLVISKCIKR